MKQIIVLLCLCCSIGIYGQPKSVPAMHFSSYETEDPVNVGNNTVYVFEIRNEGTATCTNIQLESLIPEEMEVVEAQGPVAHKAESGKVLFAPVEFLPSGEILRYRVCCKAVKTGSAKMRATLQYDQFSKPIITEEPTTIGGKTAVHIAAYDTEDPVALGQETAYVIEMRNEGSEACKNVRLEGRIPEEMEFVKAEGPGDCKCENGSAVFQPIPALLPGERLAYKIYCKAVKAGSAKITTTLNFDPFTKPIIVEEGTTIYP